MTTYLTDRRNDLEMRLRALDPSLELIEPSDERYTAFLAEVQMLDPDLAVDIDAAVLDGDADEARAMFDRGGSVATVSSLLQRGASATKGRSVRGEKRIRPKTLAAMGLGAVGMIFLLTALIPEKKETEAAHPAAGTPTQQAGAGVAPALDGPATSQTDKKVPPLESEAVAPTPAPGPAAVEAPPITATETTPPPVAADPVSPETVSAPAPAPAGMNAAPAAAPVQQLSLPNPTPVEVMSTPSGALGVPSGTSSRTTPPARAVTARAAPATVTVRAVPPAATQLPMPPVPVSVPTVDAPAAARATPGSDVPGSAASQVAFTPVAAPTGERQALTRLTSTGASGEGATGARPDTRAVVVSSSPAGTGGAAHAALVSQGSSAAPAARGALVSAGASAGTSTALVSVGTSGGSASGVGRSGLVSAAGIGSSGTASAGSTGAAPGLGGTAGAVPAPAEMPVGLVQGGSGSGPSPYRPGSVHEVVLETGVVVVPGASHPVWAQGADGSVWRGTATLDDKAMRVVMTFQAVLMGDTQVSVSAYAESTDGPGLGGRTREVGRNTAEALLNGLLNATVGFVKSQSAPSTVVNGSTTVTTEQPQNFWLALGGGVANAFVRPDVKANTVMVGELKAGDRVRVRVDLQDGGRG